LAIGTMRLGVVPLVAATCCARLLAGLIMPPRDMRRRSTRRHGPHLWHRYQSGFAIGGMVDPLMFGCMMDRGASKWVFGASVIVMILTASMSLISDR
jgi:MFS transporter, FSR family, fosmidomycin resistance protein